MYKRISLGADHANPSPTEPAYHIVNGTSECRNLCNETFLYYLGVTGEFVRGYLQAAHNVCCTYNARLEICNGIPTDFTIERPTTEEEEDYEHLGQITVPISQRALAQLLRDNYDFFVWMYPELHGPGEKPQISKESEN